MKKSYLLCTAAVALSLSAAETAAAQSAADEGSGNDDVEEIIVTATKRAQTLIEVPGAIAAIGGEQLQDQGTSQISDLQGLVPSLTVGVNRGDTVVAIRGVGQSVTGASPAVAVHIDGVYQPRPSMGELTQVDLERVEVLRGPQGTTYGRNANGGVINFITKAPTAEFGGYAQISYQNYDELRLQAAVNVPLGDSVRVRFTGERWHRGDSWVTNLAPNGPEIEVGDSWLGRAHLEVDLASNFKASVIGTYAQRDGTFFYNPTIDNPVPAAQTNLNIVAAGRPIILTTAPQTVAIDLPIDQNRRYSAVTGILEGDIGGVQVKSITAYQRFRDDNYADLDGTNLDLVRNDTNNLAKTFTQELTASFEAGPVEAVLGGFYMHDKLTYSHRFDFPLGVRLIGFPAPPPVPPRSGLEQLATPYTTKTLAFFGDFTVNLSDNFRLLGGLRYSKDDQEITQTTFFDYNPAVLTQVVQGPPLFLSPAAAAAFVAARPASPSTVSTGQVLAPFPPPLQQNVRNSQKFSSWTPRIGFQFDVTPDNVIYGSFSKGFKIGGFNYRTGVNDRYEPEELTAYEIGTKNEFGNGQFTLNASAFYYDYTNYQVEQLVGFNFFLANARKARIYGLELESLMRPSDNFTVNANVTLSNARFREFSNSDLLGSGALENLAGNPIPNAPDYSVNIGAEYRTDPVIAGGTLTFRTDLAYKSRIYYREFGRQADSQEGYALLNASVQWKSADENYSVRLYGRNLTNEDYLTSIATTSLTGNRFGRWGAPRQYGIELRTKF